MNKYICNQTVKACKAACSLIHTQMCISAYAQLPNISIDIHMLTFHKVWIQIYSNLKGKVLKPGQYIGILLHKHQILPSIFSNYQENTAVSVEYQVHMRKSTEILCHEPAIRTLSSSPTCHIE